MQVQSLGREDPLEESMATHCSILARRIPWTEEPGRLWSIGSQSRPQLKRLSMHAGTYIYLHINEKINGDDVDKKESLHAIGRNVSWCSH